VTLLDESELKFPVDKDELSAAKSKFTYPFFLPPNSPHTQVTLPARNPNLDMTLARTPVKRCIIKKNVFYSHEIPVETRPYDGFDSDCLISLFLK
jgi:hypothetical protein